MGSIPQEGDHYKVAKASDEPSRTVVTNSPSESCDPFSITFTAPEWRLFRLHLELAFFPDEEPELVPDIYGTLALVSWIGGNA